MSDPILITVSAAAVIVGLPVQRVYALIRQGTLPTGVVVHFGRTVRINSPRLQEYIDNGGQSLSETRAGGRVQ